MHLEQHTTQLYSLMQALTVMYFCMCIYMMRVVVEGFC